jgi:hypothetical protein
VSYIDKEGRHCARPDSYESAWRERPGRAAEEFSRTYRVEIQDEIKPPITPPTRRMQRIAQFGVPRFFTTRVVRNSLGHELEAD